MFITLNRPSFNLVIIIVKVSIMNIVCDQEKLSKFNRKNTFQENFFWQYTRSPNNCINS